MSSLQTPFRYDFVGSFLRPKALKDAKAAFAEGKIGKEELDTVINDGSYTVNIKEKSDQEEQNLLVFFENI